MAQRMLVPTDFSDAAQVGVDKAADLAREVEAEVVMCHVANIQRNEQGIIAALRELLDAKFPPSKAHRTRVLVHESPAVAICDCARDEDVDLIVLSTHGRTGLSHLLIGSVAERIVRLAPCPVLTVKVHPTASDA